MDRKPHLATPLVKKIHYAKPSFSQTAMLIRDTHIISATLHLHVQAAINYTPDHRPGILTLDILPVPIYRPRKDG